MLALGTGSRLGRYEVLGRLGEGGMGEVYRARDTRLVRDVAIKVLQPGLAAESGRHERFELEARASGALNHPNVAAIYDVGTHDGAPYLVCELIEGETLRSRLQSGSLPPRKAVEVAAQIARGLAAAHERGIVHRDLKPENVMVTRDGQVKVLDFGLAKWSGPGASVPDGALPLPADGLTIPGMVVGTAGYMSPEQVQGLPVDHRSDLFALGVILFEMLAGKRAFSGSSPAVTMSSILTDEPPDLSALRSDLPAGLPRTVRRCLEKGPDRRFQSAADLAFALEELASVSRVSPGETARNDGEESVDAAAGGTRWRRVALAAGILLVAATASFFAGRRASPPMPSFETLTYDRGFVPDARFVPGSLAVIYSAAWEGRPARLFLKRPESAQAMPLELPSGMVASVSSSGEIALLHDLHRMGSGLLAGTLARAPISGSAPRDLASDVSYADWSPDGKELALVREVGRASRIECPPENVLYATTTGGVSGLRFSPDGDLLAFFEHPLKSDDRGSVAVVGRDGKRRVLTDGWDRLDGLAWSPDGLEVWFTGSRSAHADYLHAVDLGGKVRLLAALPGSLHLHDVSRDGRVLLDSEERRAGIIFRGAASAPDQDVSWLDLSFVTDLSGDGGLILFNENAEATSEGYAICLRKAASEAPVVLGTGRGFALSPDGRWVAAGHASAAASLALLPTGAGQPRPVPVGRINLESAAFFPSGEELLLVGAEPGRRTRLYQVALSGGAPRPISPEGVAASFFGGVAISPDGSRVAAVGPDGAGWLYPVSGGSATPIRGLLPGELPVRWSSDPGSIFVAPRGVARVTITRLSVETGARVPWRELVPTDPAGFTAIFTIVMTPDGSAHAYTFSRRLSRLVLARGLE